MAAWLAASVAYAQPASTTASGNRMLAGALDALERHVSIAAKIRHQSRLEGHALMGSGNYWQRGTEEQRVSRWEMQTQVAGKPASFVQVFDGNHLWTDRRLPSGREVHRLDVKLLHSRLRGNNARPENSTELSGDVERMLDSALGHGGLAEMVADLLQRFDFQPPRQVQLNGLPVHALIGQWRAEELAALGVEVEKLANDDADAWPEQLPHHVLILLGRDNLFPYVIEHRRMSDAYLVSTVAGLRPTRDPLVRYELFEVQFALVLDPSAFQYKPGDVLWTDETSLVVERLRERQDLVAEKIASKAAAAGSR